MENQKEFKAQSPDTDLKVIDRRHTAAPEHQIMTTNVGPMEIMMEAVRRGAGKDELEILKEMFEFQKQIKAEESKDLFFKDFAKFKQEEITVLTDKINKSFEGHRYPSIGNFLSTVNPHLGKHNLSANYRIEEPEDLRFIRVVAVITHSNGHSIEAAMSAGPDTKGPKGGDVKTDIHGRMSTVTHLMRTTFSLVTGIGAIDPEHDDDGNSAGGSVDEFISESQVKDITKRLKAVYGNDTSMFLDWIGAETVDTIPAKDYKNAIGGIVSAEKAKAQSAKKDESRLGE